MWNSRTPALRLAKPAPLLGQHAKEKLAALLGAVAEEEAHASGERRP